MSMFRGGALRSTLGEMKLSRWNSYDVIIGFLGREIGNDTHFLCLSLWYLPLCCDALRRTYSEASILIRNFPDSIIMYQTDLSLLSRLWYSVWSKTAWNLVQIFIQKLSYECVFNTSPKAKTSVRKTNCWFQFKVLQAWDPENINISVWVKSRNKKWFSSLKAFRQTLLLAL